MSAVAAIVSIALMVLGAVFLVAAAVGVLRFPDALQRMHASTKAGTVGSIFMVMGAMVALGHFDATIIGVVAIVFLLFTVPVAAHLLGRAIYVSGADLLQIEGRDALEGRLARHAKPLEERSRT